jgi:hypothetical protein
MYPEYVPRLEAHEAGLTMRTVGWLLLVFDALFIAFFVPASLRDGSELWPAWAVAQGLVGVALVASGALKEKRTEVIEGSIVPMPPSYRQTEETKKAA